MIHVVVMKRLIGLPLLIHIELLLRSRSRSFCVPTAQPCYHPGNFISELTKCKSRLREWYYVPSNTGVPARVLPGGAMRPATIFVNFV
jgi:hypothetical protein